MFSAIYIKKCKKAQDELQFLRTFTIAKPNGDNAVQPRFYFDKGDHFHHERTMGEYGFEQVERVERENLSVIAGRRVPYRQEECIWIPTAEQLRDGLNNIVFSLGDTSELSEEQILDLYMRKHERKRWSGQKDSWESIK